MEEFRINSSRRNTANIEGGHSSSRGRTYKLLKKTAEPLPEAPAPPEDFSLENYGDISTFFKLETDPGLAPPTPTAGPQYNQKGQVVPFTVVGPTTLFTKGTTNLQSPQRIFTRSKMLDSSRKTIIDPETRFNQKLEAIDKGKKTEVKQEKERLRHMKIGERIAYSQQTNTLEHFNKNQSKWQTIESHLSKKVDKPVGDLMANRAFEYREKVEEWDFLDRQVSSKEKAGDQVWYMTLRENPSNENKLGTYLPVGNPMHQLYATIVERTPTAQPIIRKAGATKPSGKTFRENEWLQLKYTDGNTKHTIRVDPDIDVNELQVIGIAKLPIEIEALKTVGVNHLDINKEESARVCEVFAEHYETNTFY